MQSGASPGHSAPTAPAPSRSARKPAASWPASAELLQEPQIVLEEQAQVIHAITQHRQPVDAHAEGIGGVALAVDAARSQHIRMHHAAAEHLDPAGLLAQAAAGAAAFDAGDV